VVSRTLGRAWFSSYQVSGGEMAVVVFAVCDASVLLWD
jgi:hypothetical protein